MTRHEVLEMASLACLKELYSKVQPAVDWDDFMEENRLYSKAYKQWESLYKESPEKAGNVLDFCGPRPHEFYYLPKEIIKDICDSYVYAYRIDQQQELLDTIETLKNYCKEPIVDKWIERNGDEPGYRGYDHTDNLQEEIRKIFDKEILPDICKQYNKQFNLNSTGIESSFSGVYSKIFQNKFFEFLDMAGNFYNWNRDLNAFNTTVYLGPSPNSNKKAVIDNWKKYRNKYITIDDSLYIEED